MVADLYLLALIHRREVNDGTLLSLHPLVPYMTRARLSLDNLTIWIKHTATFHYLPLVEPNFPAVLGSLTILLANYYAHWHLNARIERYERYCKYAITILESAPGQQYHALVGGLSLVAEATRYTNPQSTHRKASTSRF
jgi:hypothetical protein